MKLKRVSIENASIAISHSASSSSAFFKTGNLSSSSARRSVRSPLDRSRHLAIFPPPASAQGFPEGTFVHVSSPPPPALYTNLLLSDPFRIDVPRITHPRPGSYNTMNDLVLSRRSCFDIFPPTIPSLALPEPEPEPEPELELEPEPEPRQYPPPPVIYIPAAEDDPECIRQYELAAALFSRGNTHRKRSKGKTACEKKEYVKSHLSQEVR